MQLKDYWWKYTRRIKSIFERNKNAIFLAVITGVIGLLLTVPFECGKGCNTSAPPQFNVLTNPANPDSNVYLQALNGPANKEKPLSVFIDGIFREKIGKPLKDSDPQIWHFNPTFEMFPEEVLKPGLHKISLGFEKGKMSQEESIAFSSEILYKMDMERIGDKLLVDIHATKEFQNPRDTIFLEINYFGLEGAQSYIKMPEIKVDPEFNIIYYDFRHVIPIPHDSAFLSAFGAMEYMTLRVFDNSDHSHEFSFTADELVNNKGFSYNLQNLSDFEFNQELIPGEGIAGNFRFIPDQHIRAGSLDEEPPFILKVSVNPDRSRNLKWNSVKGAIEYGIIRNEKEIHRTTDTEFYDPEKVSSNLGFYQIKAIGSNGIIAFSNLAEIFPNAAPAPAILGGQEDGNSVSISKFNPGKIDEKPEGRVLRFYQMEKILNSPKNDGNLNSGGGFCTMVKLEDGTRICQSFGCASCRLIGPRTCACSQPW